MSIMIDIENETCLQRKARVLYAETENKVISDSNKLAEEMGEQDEALQELTEVIEAECYGPAVKDMLDIILKAIEISDRSAFDVAIPYIATWAKVIDMNLGDYTSSGNFKIDMEAKFLARQNEQVTQLNRQEVAVPA